MPLKKKAWHVSSSNNKALWFLLPSISVSVKYSQSRHTKPQTQQPVLSISLDDSLSTFNSWTNKQQMAVEWLAPVLARLFGWLSIYYLSLWTQVSGVLFISQHDGLYLLVQDAFLIFSPQLCARIADSYCSPCSSYSSPVGCSLQRVAKANRMHLSNI